MFAYRGRKAFDLKPHTCLSWKSVLLSAGPRVRGGGGNNIVGILAWAGSGSGSGSGSRRSRVCVSTCSCCRRLAVAAAAADLLLLQIAMPPGSISRHRPATHTGTRTHTGCRWWCRHSNEWIEEQMAAGLQLGCNCECFTNIELSFLAAIANTLPRRRRW